MTQEERERLRAEDQEAQDSFDLKQEIYGDFSEEVKDND